MDDDPTDEMTDVMVASFAGNPFGMFTKYRSGDVICQVVEDHYTDKIRDHLTNNLKFVQDPEDRLMFRHKFVENEDRNE